MTGSLATPALGFYSTLRCMLLLASRLPSLVARLLAVAALAVVLAGAPAFSQEDPPVDPEIPEHCVDDPTAFGCPDWVDPCADVTGPWATELALSAPSSVAWGDSITIEASASTTQMCAPSASGGDISITITGFGGSYSDTIEGSSGSVTFPPFDNAGDYTVTASYSGEDDISGSSASTSLSVQKAITRTEITFTPDMDVIERGDPPSLTLTARVYREPDPNPPGGYPQGFVRFDLGGLRYEDVDLTEGGVLEFTTETFFIPSGTFDITATYFPLKAPDMPWGGNDEPSSATKRLSVGVIGTSMTLTATPSSAGVGVPVELTATLSPDTIIDPLEVSFYAGDLLLGTEQTSSRVATLTTTQIPAGIQTVRAEFAGTDNYSLSSAETTVVVNGIQTSTLVSASPTAVAPGGSSTLTAQIIPQQDGGSPIGGMVEFLDGDVVVGTGTVVAGTGSFTLTNLTEGTRYYRARYLGDTMYLGSTSDSTVGIAVGRLATTTSITPSNQAVSSGAPVSFSVQVAGLTGDPVPSGTVTFLNGAVELGTYDLANGVASHSFDLPDGLHSITARYNGDMDQAPSTSSAATAIVGTSASAINLQVIPAQPSIVDEVSIRASVIGTGTPTGQVRISGHGISVPDQSLLAGQTTFELGILPAGDYEFLVEYLGGGANDASNATASFSIAKRASTTTISAAEGLLPPGSDLPMTIAVAGGGFGTPEGSVTLTRNGSETLAVLALSGGTVDYVLTDLPAGPFSVEAVYAGDETFAGSSASISRSVGLVATNIVLAKTADPSPIGAANPITATISHFDTSGAQPTGSIVFAFNGDFAQTVPLVDGVASVDLSGLPVGSYVVTASYAGDARFAAASQQTMVAISKSVASIAVAQSASSSTFGDAVTFTATLTPNAPETAIPSGDVVFAIGGREETATLVNGIASVVLDDLPAGSLSVIANYGGDDVFEPATSTSIGHVVNKIASNATLASSSNPSAPGQEITLTATVASAAGTPAGTISFQRGGVTIGTVALDENGIASLTWTEPATGTFDFVANYSGSDSHVSTSSNIVNQIVGQASASLALDVPAEPIAAGTSILMTATVSATPPATGIPEGNVQFSIDGGAAATVALENGVASWTTPALEAGTRTFTASYEGFGEFSPASDTKIRDVTAIGTVTTLSASPNPSALGGTVALVALVSAPAGMPQGDVSFFANGSLIDVATATDGEARLNWSPSAIGTRILTASYSGSSIHAASVSADVPHVVNALGLKGTVDLALTAPATVPAGEDVLLSIDISPVAPAADIPTGTYAIIVDGVTSQSVAVVAPTTQVALTGLASGTRSIVVRYSGDASFDGRDSSQAMVQIAMPSADIATTTSVAVAPNPLDLGGTATITANVIPASGSVSSGTVTFYVDGAVIGSVTPASGEATFSYVPDSMGSKSIAASYSGDASFLPSTSLVTTLSVEEPSSGKVATSIVATPSSIIAIEGETATIDVEVVPAGAGIPTGNLAIQLDDGPVITLPLVDASASWTSPALTAGNHTIHIAYLGDEDFLLSSGQVPVMVTGPQGEISTSTSLTLSSTTAVVGETISFTANVLPSSGGAVASGSIEFFVDGSSIGTASVANGSASIEHATTSIGTYQAVAIYGGAVGEHLGSTSASVPFSVTEADVELEATLTTVSSVSTQYETGDTATFSILVSATESGGVPTGYVDVVFDGNPPASVALIDGAASWTSPALSAGSHTVLVVYDGDAAFSGSASLPFVFEATDPAVESATTTEVFAAPYPGIAGQTSTLSATVAAQSGVVVSIAEVDFHVDGASIGTAIVVNGAASISWTPPAAATYDVRAFYAGSAGAFSASSSPLSSYLVEAPIAQKIATTTVMTPETTETVAGEAVDIGIVVAPQPPASGTPTGSVFVVIDGEAPVEISLVDGSASWTTPALVAGSHSISTSYSGDDDFAASVATTTTIVASAPAEASATTTIAMATPFPGIVGQETTFTASVSAQNGATVDGGSAEFRRDGVPFATVPVVNGTATTTWTPDAVADHTIEIAYSGVPNVFLASTSETGAYPVEEPAVIRTPTTTTVSSWDIVTVPSRSIEVDVVVAAAPPAVSVPSGMISVVLNGGTPESLVLIDGRATWSTALLPVGTHTIVITYSGDGDHEPSSSDPLVIEVGDQAVGTTTSIGATPFPGIVGEQTVFTASVSSGAGVVEGGTVTFGRDGVAFAAEAVVNGVATTTWTPDAAGSYVITAEYSGVADALLPSSATPGSYPVEEATGRDATTTSISAAPNAIDLGQSSTLTATVVGSGAETGAVEFRRGDEVLGASALVNGQASLEWAPTAVGRYDVSAHYSGDASHDPSSSGTTSIVVLEDGGTLVDSRIALTIQPSQPYAGQPAVVVATVSAVAPAVGTPTGEVTFTMAGVDTTVSLVDGRASFATPALVAGPVSISASYAGDAVFATSSGTIEFLVLAPGMQPTTSVLTSSATPAAIGQTVVYDLQVSAPNGSTPAGSAILVIDGADQETIQLVNGRATWTRQFASSGSYQVGALYTGSPAHGPSASNVIIQQVTEEMVPGTITIRQVAGSRDAVFAFSSDAPGLSGSISTAHGRGQIGPVEVQPGTYTILARDPAEVGYVLSMISCTDDDGSVDVLARKAVVNLAPGESVVCTFSSIDASLETVELIEDFLDARADILISNLPGIDRRIDRLQDEIARQSFSPGQMLMGYSSVFDGAPMRFSSSLSAIDGAMGNRQPNQFDVWIEGAVGTVQRGGAGEGLYGIVSVGADYRVSDDMLVGVMGQYDRMNLGQSTGVSVSGDGWLVGPYMTMRLGNGVYLDLMGAVGASRNDISPYGTYTDEFHTRRYLLNATLQGDWAMGGWTFSPRARATYFDETSDSYMDSRGIRIPEVNARKGSLSIGPGASYAFSLDAIELEVGARAEVAADISGANGAVGVQNARGRLEGMLDIGLPGGANVDLTLVYDGIGSSNTSIGARAGLLVPLN